MVRTSGADGVDAPTPKRALVLAGAIREKIVRGDLAPGDPLPVEAALMEEHQASRFIVREAMRVLEVEGLVAIRRGPGGGPRVLRPSIAVAAQAVGIQFQLLDVALLEVWEVRTDLCARAVSELAVSEHRAEAIVGLQVLVARLAGIETSEEFPLRWVELTEELVRLAGNDARYVLVRALHEITESQLLEANRRTDPDIAASFRARVVTSCATIVRHIADGDADLAEAGFREQSRWKAEGMALLLGDATVVDVFSGGGLGAPKIPS